MKWPVFQPRLGATGQVLCLERIWNNFWIQRLMAMALFLLLSLLRNLHLLYNLAFTLSCISISFFFSLRISGSDIYHLSLTLGSCCTITTIILFRIHRRTQSARGVQAWSKANEEKVIKADETWLSKAIFDISTVVTGLHISKLDFKQCQFQQYVVESSITLTVKNVWGRCCSAQNMRGVSSVML